MTARTPTYLKGLFENGDPLTQSAFEDVFDSYVNLSVSGKQTIVSDLQTSGEIICARVSAASYFTSTVSADTVFANTSISSPVGNLVSISSTTGNIATVNSTNVSAATVNVTNRLTSSVDSSVKATGTTRASAKSISSALSLLVTVSAGTEDSVVIGGGYPGFVQYIINSTTNTAQVFPPSGGTFDGGTPDAARLLNPSGRMTIYHITSASFYTLRGV